MGQWYEKYRWFFTSAGKLVIGGKNAGQNEDVVKNHLSRNDLVMHTKEPGSPFVVIKQENDKEITVEDIREAAIFTASFSKAWKKSKKQTEIHIFKPGQIVKEKGSKTGTFTVLGKIRKAKAELKLALTIQKNKLRAVPLTAAQDIFCIVQPGKIQKEEAAEEITKRLKQENLSFKKEEILSALPAGKFSIKET